MQQQTALHACASGQHAPATHDDPVEHVPPGFAALHAGIDVVHTPALQVWSDEHVPAGFAALHAGAPPQTNAPVDGVHVYPDGQVPEQVRPQPSGTPHAAPTTQFGTQPSAPESPPGQRHAVNPEPSALQIWVPSTPPPYGHVVVAFGAHAGGHPVVAVEIIRNAASTQRFFTRTSIEAKAPMKR